MSLGEPCLGREPSEARTGNAQEGKELPMDRLRASEILTSVADMGLSAHWPADVTPELLGRAIRRLMPNNGLPPEESLQRLIDTLERGKNIE